MSRRNCVVVVLLFTLLSCSKEQGDDSSPPPNFSATGIKINGQPANSSKYNIGVSSAVAFSFSSAINKSTVNSAFSFTNKSGDAVAYAASYENNDKTVVLRPSANLKYLTSYSVSVATSLQSVDGGHLISNLGVNFTTTIDSSRKFAIISDDSLLTLVQQQTFKYFWDFGHPVSGMARERNTSGETVTTGGTGFGIMTIPVAITRNFIARGDGLARVQKIVGFLKNNAQHFHGALSHWLNGSTGAVVPFAANDDGADLVETSYLIMGLLTARQYFDAADTSEIKLRADINDIWNQVEWDWFRQNGQDVLYWTWSPNSRWGVNVPVQGWNESLITYVLAASSGAQAIPKIVYDNGFARNGAMLNNSTYYGYTLPLGEPYGGPLFVEHYSFLGIDPHSLRDSYADYQTQTLNHTRINYEYCRANPKQYFGYSDSCWGLTASDVQNGYTASSPTNDVSVIAPTTAISSIPYTPAESMKALKFFYYVLGDKLWGEYGFKDAFSLQNLWFADSYLAIDEGPILAMIENYRTGLLWNLFTSCPEVKSGMTALGFNAPYL